MIDMQKPTGLGEHLRTLLQHFHAAASVEFASDELEAVAEELLHDAAVQAWVEQQMAQFKVNALSLRNGFEMDMEPAEEMALLWVAAARTLLQEAENYCERVLTRPEDSEKASYSMGVAIPELPERYVLTVQRVAPGKLTPHEARVRAEHERDALASDLERLTTSTRFGNGKEEGAA